MHGVKRIPLKNTKLKLRWVELDERSIQYMAQLEVLGQREKAQEQKDKMLQALGISKAPAEEYLEAWIGAMAKENGVTIKEATEGINKEWPENASLAGFVLTMG